MRVATRFISLVLTPLVTFLPMAAQTLPAATAGGAQAAALQIQVLNRDPLQLAAGARTQKGYTVLVTDAGGRPVANAAIACRLPDSDPTGAFVQGGHSAVLYTGADGRAQIPAIQWGSTAGTASLRVTANKDGAHAAILIEQKLVGPVVAAAPPAVSVVTREASAAPARPNIPAIAAPEQQQPEVSVSKPAAAEKVHSSSKKKWIIIAILAGAAAGAAGFAAKGKSSSSSSSPQMSIGSPTVSVGQP